MGMLFDSHERHHQKQINSARLEIPEFKSKSVRIHSTDVGMILMILLMISKLFLQALLRSFDSSRKMMAILNSHNTSLVDLR